MQASESFISRTVGGLNGAPFIPRDSQIRGSNNGAADDGTVGRVGFFEKYNPEQKASILWKVSMAMTVLSLVLSVTGLGINRYNSQEEVQLELNGVKVNVPSFRVSATAISLGTDGCDGKWKVDPSLSRLHSLVGMTFTELSRGPHNDPAADFFLDDSKRLIVNTHMGQFSSFDKYGTASRVFGIMGVALQFVALLWTAILKAPPSAFFFNRSFFGLSHKQHLQGATYHLILAMSAVFLFIACTLMSVIMQPISARVANFALDWCTDSPLDAMPRGQKGLEYMKFLGKYIKDYAKASGATFMTYSISIVLVFGQLWLVFYLAILQVRTQSRVNYHLPDSQMKLLPWYSKILPVKVSFLFLVVAAIINSAAAYSARVRGYDLNIYFYENSFQADTHSRSWSLSDVFLDRVHQYVVDRRTVKMLLFFWIPMIALVGFGTVDYAKYISKVIEALAVLLLGSALVGISTVPPTPAFVLQKPQCFDSPHRPPTFGKFFSFSESCNDQMYSVYSVLIVIPVMCLWFYIRYGSVRRKRLAYLTLALCCIGSLLILVTSRQQYSIDVYIGTVVTAMYFVSQSAAFKLLFRFGTVQPGMLHKPPVVLSDKVVPALDEVIRKFELYFMTTTPDGAPVDSDELTQIKSEFNQLIEVLLHAKNQALEDMTVAVPMSSLEEGDDSSSVDLAEEGDKKNS